MRIGGRTRPFVGANGKPLANSVAEARFLNIGGVDQWVMVRGRDAANPLLIVLHGGPGASATALHRTSNAELESAFTIVYWDQRGAGRSLTGAAKATSLTIDRLVEDLDALIDAMREKFGKPKVALMGHSWGTALGTIYTSRSSVKVSAYVGIGQISNMAQSEAESYAFALAEAQRRGHRKALQELQAMGPPPLAVPALMRQRRWLMALGGALGPNLTLPKLLWRTMTAPEATPLDVVRLVQGTNFSIRSLWAQMESIRLDRDNRRFDVPVFFLLGRLDKQVVATLAADYFERIEAPHKELVWFEHSGHFVPFEEPAKFNTTLIERVRPFAV
jgi:pimeloyl-ACP methyl ester carboxylesterase